MHASEPLHRIGPDARRAAQSAISACRRVPAARALAALPVSHLDGMLEEIAFQLEADAEEIFAANALDIAAGEQAGLAPAMLDRLRITEKSLDAIITGVRQVLGLPQPLGEIMRRVGTAQRHRASPRSACPSASSPSSTSRVPT